MHQFFHRVARLCVVVLAYVLLAAPMVMAQQQHLRTEGTVFLKPRVGLSNYAGDNEKSPLNFNGDAFSAGTPWSIAAEVGYQFSVPFSVSLAYMAGDYPVITQYPNRGREDDAVAEDPSLRSSIQAFGRYMWAERTTRVAPFVNFGLVFSSGTVTQDVPPDFQVEESGSALGILLGAGFDVALNPRASFFAEINSGFHFPWDDALDGSDDNGFGSVDILSGVGVGFKINMKPAITPAMVTSLSCPTGNVITGQEVTFSAMTNIAIATQPVTMGWDLGDGNTVPGETVSHTYSEDGSKTVTFTVTNEGGTHSMNCDVTVIAPAEIVTASASKSTVSICDDDPSVSFSANTRGSAPLSFSWDFGDGNTSTSQNPSHTYENVGSYSVTLTVTNAGGSDSRTITVEVNDNGCFNCDISQMNSVFFDRNSSVLTPEARVQLDENLEILQNCTFNARIEGHASRDERNAQQLSDDRARAVMQFYTDNGIEGSRLTSMGMGASGQTTKKGGASQFRRVDTIPIN